MKASSPDIGQLRGSKRVHEPHCHKFKGFGGGAVRLERMFAGGMDSQARRRKTDGVLEQSCGRVQRRRRFGWLYKERQISLARREANPLTPNQDLNKLHSKQ